MAAPVIIVLGPPGAGKGTQSELLSHRLAAVHLSSGQVLRDSQSTRVVREIGGGNLARTEDFLAIVGPAIAAVDAQKTVILDSVGRMLPEAKWLTAKLQELGRPIECVIYLNVDQAEAIQRNLKRGREDDDKQDQQLRWQLYQKETLPVLDYYRELGLLKEVDGAGTVDEVAERIKGVLNET